MDKEAFVARLWRDAKEFLKPDGGLCTIQLESSPADLDVCCGTPTFRPDFSRGGQCNRRALCPEGTEKPCVVFRNKAFAAVLHSDFIKTHCSCCCRRVQSEILNQCSGCKHVRYCSEDCQKMDWNGGGHSKECKHLKTLRFPEPHVNDLRLLIRTYHTIYFSKKGKLSIRCSHHQDLPVTGTHNSIMNTITSCGTDHVRSLSMAAGVPEYGDAFDGSADREMANNILFQAAYILHHDEAEVNFVDLMSLYAALHTNNFGILDDLFQVVGSGVYPQTALLEHSCCPSVILTYPMFQGTFPVAQGVALRSLQANEELTHSYVDLCHPFNLRREHLRRVHNFVCSCLRCESQLEIYKPSFAGWTAEQENLCSALEALASDPLSMRDLVQSRLVQQPAAQSTTLHAIVEKIVAGKGPLSYKVYKENCRMFEKDMCEQNVKQAAMRCKRIVSTMLIFFSHVEFHPLLGLQLFTLGDLLLLAETPVEAIKYYEWCKQQLSPTHDCNESGSDLLSRLDNQLEEARRARANI